MVNSMQETDVLKLFCCFERRCCNFAGTVVQGDGELNVTFDQLMKVCILYIYYTSYNIIYVISYEVHSERVEGVLQALRDLWFLDFPSTGKKREKRSVSCHFVRHQPPGEGLFGARLRPPKGHRHQGAR